MTHHAMIDGASGIELTTVLYDFDAKGANIEPPTKDPGRRSRCRRAAELFSRALRDNMERLANSNPIAPLQCCGKQQALLRKAFACCREFDVAAGGHCAVQCRRRRSAPRRCVDEDAAERNPRDPSRPRRHDQRRGADRRLGGRGALSRVSTTNGCEAQHLRIMCPVNVRTEGQQRRVRQSGVGDFPDAAGVADELRRRASAPCARKSSASRKNRKRRR